MATDDITVGITEKA